MTAGGAPFGLPVPTLATGSPANVTLLDLAAEWQVGEAGYESRSANCAFAGRNLTGRVRMTIAAGVGRLPRALVRDRGGACVRTLDRDRAALVVVDVQEAFRPAVEGFDEVVENTRRLMEGAEILGLPVVVTEQYPKGLGRTVEELGDVDPVEKTCFSAARADGFDLDGRDQALVCGIETHVCVSQTAHDLLERGVEVHVAQRRRHVAHAPRTGRSACTRWSSPARS